MNNIIRTGAIAVAIVTIVLTGTWMALQFKTFEPVYGQATWSTPAELTGYMWAGVQNDSSGGRQGMGWISLNCRTGGPAGQDVCATSNYKVEIDDTDRSVDGYAWGSNTPSVGGTAPSNQTGLGWVRFGGLTGCPSGTCDARVEGNDTNGYELMGWARACSVFANPAVCSGALADSTVTGGWDGWISLNCANHEAANCSTYSVRLNDNGTFYQVNPNDSTAWGSDVLGAVSFALAGFDRPCTGSGTTQCVGNVSQFTGTNMWCESSTPVDTTCVNGCNATTGLCNGTAITGDLNVSTSVVRRGSTVTIDWNVPAAGSCTVTGPNGFSVTSLTGSQPVTITLNQTTFTLTCDGVVVDTATVRLLPDTFES